MTFSPLRQTLVAYRTPHASRTGLNVIRTRPAKHALSHIHTHTHTHAVLCDKIHIYRTFITCATTFAYRLRRGRGIADVSSRTREWHVRLFLEIFPFLFVTDSCDAIRGCTSDAYRILFPGRFSRIAPESCPGVQVSAENRTFRRVASRWSLCRRHLELYPPTVYHGEMSSTVLDVRIRSTTVAAVCRRPVSIIFCHHMSHFITCYY